MPDIRKMLSLYFVAGTQDCRHLEKSPADALLFILEAALQGGISCFQLREKGKNSLQDPYQIQQLAKQCRDLCQQYHVPFFINDNVKLALTVQADGIHIGQEDSPIHQVIELCRQHNKLLGLSINTLQQAIDNAKLSTISYFGVGPIFATQSKDDVRHVVGIDLIRQIRRQSIPKPLVAIGGINIETASTIRQAGADGIAVISALTQASDITKAVQKLKGI